MPQPIHRSLSTITRYLVIIRFILRIHIQHHFLIGKEALNAANASPPAEAYWAVNQIRERARHPDHKDDGVVLPDLSNMTKEAFLDTLLVENAKELCWEGKRKPMLIRTGKLKEYITPPRFSPQWVHGYYYDPGLNFDENTHLLYPIPQHEMDINPNLVQNPGY